MTCSKCKIDKLVEEFYSRPNRKNKRQSYCKKCFHNYCRDRWIDTKIKAINYKGGKCLDCNLTLLQQPYYIFEFHHLNPSKKDVDWKDLRKRSWNKITYELDKCVCLCVICHKHREHNIFAKKMAQEAGLEPTRHSTYGFNVTV